MVGFYYSLKEQFNFALEMHLIGPLAPGIAKKIFTFPAINNYS